jgi:hypothetical protein
MRHLTIAALLLALTSGPAFAADPASSPKDQQAVGVLHSLGAELGTCRLTRMTEKQALLDELAENRDFARRGLLSHVDAYKFSQEAIAKSAAAGKYKKCKAEAMVAFSPLSRQLVSSVSGTALEGPAKDVLAQWMTTMEATDDDATFPQELGRFNTLSNRLKLDLTLK